MKILITGGAGFIGSNLIKQLLKEKDTEIIILDIFSEKIHGVARTASIFEEDNRIKVIRDTVVNVENYVQELKECDCIIHLAAETGTGQSMYEIEEYFETNVIGTNKLFKVIQENEININKFILTSSRSVYGEGAYECDKGQSHYFVRRGINDLKKGFFEPKNSHGDILKSVPSTKNTPKDPLSYYALTKSMQEDIVMYFCSLMKINYGVLRLQNVYGPGQSLINPYTGVLAVFSNLARENAEINIFEDGLESRDFIFIDDVTTVIKNLLNLDKMPQILNVGSGKRTTIIEVANKIKDYFSSSSVINISGNFRIGDIRHNSIDFSELEPYLGDKKLVNFSEGLEKFLNWAIKSDPSSKKFYESIKEMKDSHFLIDD